MPMSFHFIQVITCTVLSMIRTNNYLHHDLIAELSLGEARRGGGGRRGGRRLMSANCEFLRPQQTSKVYKIWADIMWQKCRGQCLQNC